MRSAASSAPGKAILMGEHAAVYGRPALVAAVTLRTLVRLEEAGRGVVLDLPVLGWRGSTTWEAIEGATSAARETWSRFEAGRGAWSPLDDSNPGALVTVALGEAAAAFGPDPPPPLEVRVESALPPGSGFGSSAALAVALAAAWARFVGRAPRAADLAAVAREVERRQHGTPSGVDAAAALHGGVLWAQPDEEGSIAVRPLIRTPRALERFGLFQSGVPSVTTGTVVAAVRRRLESEPHAAAALDEIEAASRALCAALESESDASAAIVAAVRRGEAALERLGVVPSAVARAIRAVEAAGGAAKVSGAGALEGDRAGLVLVYHPDPDWTAGFLPPSLWRRVDGSLGAEGVRSETRA